MTYDSIVLGLGPAGAMAAYDMAKAGLKVLAIEKARLPRYKTCGGCVAAKVDRILDFSIDEVTERVIYGAVYSYRGRNPVEIASDKPIGYMTMRDRLDALLVEKAKGAGALIHDGERAGSILVLDKGDRGDGRDRGLELVTSATSYRSRTIVGADGVNSLAARMLGGGASIRKGVALEVEARVSSAAVEKLGSLARIDFGAVPGGYGWVFPKKDVLSFGIGGMTGGGASFREHLEIYRRREKTLAGVQIERVFGHQIPLFEGGLSRLSGDNIILAGDAGGLVDPFLGEGIYYAMRSGQLAAKAILEYLNKSSELASYDRMVEAELYPDLNAALKVSRRAYSHPWLWHQLMRTNRDLLGTYYDVIRGEESYDGFLSRVKGKVAVISRIKERVT